MFDPYTVRVRVLRSCDDQVFQLGSVKNLPGGGMAYSYPTTGFTFTLPPSHFDPLKASDRRLREYGFPTRRQLGAGWYSVVRHMQHPVTPPPYLVALAGVSAASPGAGRAVSSAQGRPCQSGITVLCWGGRYVTGHTYTSVDTKWWEPHFTASGCDTAAWSQWAGLGGIFGGYLGQDGTLFNAPNAGAHQAFIAKVSSGDPGNAIPVGLYATPGYQFFASVAWDAGNSWYDFELVNEHTNQSVTAHSSKVSDPGAQSAEVITEDPFIGGQWTDPGDL
ncbi:MAG TPA: hypothetical protein VGI31_10550 [Streptosporangiaceae bacterium]